MSGESTNTAGTSSKDIAKGSSSIVRMDTTQSYVIKILSGNGNKELSEAVASALNVGLVSAEIGQFSDGETKIQVHENIRGTDVFIIQPTCTPVNDNLMELLLLIHTLKLSSAKRITAVVPYFGYARQDRKNRPRVPISASAVAHLIESMAPQRIVTVDLHCGQIQGFFHSIPVDNLFADVLFINYLNEKLTPEQKLDTIIVSPDAGAVNRARHLADNLGGLPVVTILKRRVQANQIDSMQIVGDVEKKICIIVDDMIDTGGTLCKATGLLMENGAASVSCFATHGVFSGRAMQNINESQLAEVIVTDTMPQKKNLAACSKLHVLSIAPLLAAAIERIHHESSISQLFDGGGGF